MPIGDSDFGVFFGADFGTLVTFGTATAYGIFDEGSGDARFGDVTVSDTEPRLEMAANAFNPMPRGGAAPSVLLVKGNRYVVTALDPLDDGATVALRLRKS